VILRDNALTGISRYTLADEGALETFSGICSEKVTHIRYSILKTNFSWFDYE